MKDLSEIIWQRPQSAAQPGSWVKFIARIIAENKLTYFISTYDRNNKKWGSEEALINENQWSGYSFDIGKPVYYCFDGFALFRVIYYADEKIHRCQAYYSIIDKVYLKTVESTIKPQFYLSFAPELGANGFYELPEENQKSLKSLVCDEEKLEEDALKPQTFIQNIWQRSQIWDLFGKSWERLKKETPKDQYVKALIKILEGSPADDSFSLNVQSNFESLRYHFTFASMNSLGERFYATENKKINNNNNNDEIIDNKPTLADVYYFLVHCLKKELKNYDVDISTLKIHEPCDEWRKQYVGEASEHTYNGTLSPFDTALLHALVPYMSDEPIQNAQILKINGKQRKRVKELLLNSELTAYVNSLIPALKKLREGDSNGYAGNSLSALFADLELSLKGLGIHETIVDYQDKRKALDESTAKGISEFIKDWEYYPEILQMLASGIKNQDNVIHLWRKIFKENPQDKKYHFDFFSEFLSISNLRTFLISLPRMLFNEHLINFSQHYLKYSLTNKRDLFALYISEYLEEKDLFYKAGFGVDIELEDGITPLWQMWLTDEEMTPQQKKSIKWLITHDAKVDFQYEDGNTPLSYAVKRKLDNELIELLLQHGANPNTQDKEGVAPLHHAIDCPSSTFKLLIEHGADFNIRDNRGTIIRALIRKIHSNEQEEEKLFLLVEAIRKKYYIPAKDEDGATLLHHLFDDWGFYLEYDSLKFWLISLVRSGLDINAKDHQGRTPLHTFLLKYAEHACAHRYLFYSPRKDGLKTLILVFLALGANLTTEDNYKNTPLQSVIQNNQDNKERNGLMKLFRFNLKELSSRHELNKIQAQLVKIEDAFNRKYQENYSLRGEASLCPIPIIFEEEGINIIPLPSDNKFEVIDEDPPHKIEIKESSPEDDEVSRQNIVLNNI